MSSSASVGARPQPQSPTAPLWAGLLSAGLLAALAGPVALRPLAVVAPLPLMIQRLRGAAGSTFLGALLAVAVLGLAFNGWTTPLAGALLLAPGLLMAEAVARGRGLRKGCGWALAAMSLGIAAFLVAQGPRMETLLGELLKATPESLARGAEAFDDLAGQLLRQQLVALIYPGLWVVLGGFGVVLNALLLRAWLLRNDPGWLESGEFERLRWPLSLTLPFVGAGAALFSEPTRQAGLNALVVVAFFFALQGLAVVGYYLQRLAGPPLLRAGLAALVLFTPLAPHCLVLLGLFDNWADFRKWADPPAEDA